MATMIGTASTDTIEGTNKDDTILGLGGNDTLNGGNGQDSLYGGDGNDKLNGGTGNDTEVGGAGNDIIGAYDGAHSDTGDDLLIGDYKSFQVLSYSTTTTLSIDEPYYAMQIMLSNSPLILTSSMVGQDHLYGGEGDDILYGDFKVANIKVEADSGANSMSFLAPLQLGNNDSLEGGNGNDRLFGDMESLTLEVKGGLSGMASASFNSSTLVFGNDVELGGNGDDFIVGDIKEVHILIQGGMAGSGLSTYADLSNNNFLFGNDSLNGGNGRDTLIGDVETFEWSQQAGTANGGVAGDFADASANASAQSSANTFTFGDDTLEGGASDDTLIGDVKTFTWSGLGGSATGGTAMGAFANADANAYSASDSNKITFGMDVLKGGSGNNVLVGDVDIFTWNMMGGTGTGGIAHVDTFADANANGYAWSRGIGDEITFGNDTLESEGGDDILIGDVKVFSLWQIGGDGMGGVATTNVTFDGNFSFQFIHATGFANSDNFSENINFGNDVLKGGAGNDLLIGDVDRFDWHQEDGTGVAGSVHTILNGSGVLVARAHGYSYARGIQNSFNFGSDHIEGGEADDIIIGDVQSFTLLAKGNLSVGGNASNDGLPIEGSFFDALALTDGFSGPIIYNADIGGIFFGSDTLTGDKGNDSIVGDVKTLEFKLVGGIGIAGTSTALVNGQMEAGSVSDPELSATTISFGGDSINGGEGNDQIIGDVEQFKVTLVGGEAYGGTVNNLGFSFLVDNVSRADTAFGRPVWDQESGIANQITFGADSIQGGDGSDTIIGDVKVFAWQLTGGTAVGGTILSGSPSTSSAIGESMAVATGNNINFGADIINGGKGNDFLLGDAESITLNLMGGTATGANGYASAIFKENALVFGDDSMDGGQGDDAMIGDLNSLTIVTMNGTSIDQGTALATMVGNVINLGNDTLIGGDGNDMLYGDMQDMSPLNLFISLDPSNLVLGGNDILRGGHGNDYLDGGWGIDCADYSDASAGLVININVNDTIQDLTSVGLGVDTLHSIEGAIGTNFDDTLIGNIQDNIFQGGKGNDTLIGGGGNDTAVFSGQHQEYILSVDSNENITVEDQVYGRDGIDTLSNFHEIKFHDGTYTVVLGTSNDDTLNGGSGSDILWGGMGNDILVSDPGLESNNSLDGAQIIDRSSFGALPGDVPNEDDFSFMNLPSVNIQGEISVAGDKDFYKISLLAGETLFIDIDQAFDTVISLFNSAGVKIGEGDDGAAPGEDFSFSSYLEFTTTVDGDYYIGITEFPQYLGDGGVDLNSGESTDSYHMNLSISNTPAVVLPGYEFGMNAASIIEPPEGSEGNKDILIGGEGNDILTGGDKSDTFLFDLATNTGHDTITDFTQNDFLQFTHLMDVNADTVININDLLAITHVVNDGSGNAKLMIDTNGASITIANMPFVPGHTQFTDYISVDHIVV